MTRTRRTFLQQLGLGTASVGFMTLTPGCRSASPAPDGHSLPHSTPEAEGVSTAGLLAFLDALGQSRHEMHSFILVRHGRVVAEGWWSPYAPHLNHTMYSMSKSFTSTAVGFAVAEGRLSVDDRVVSFFPEDRPAQVSDHLAALRVKDLLTMSVGNEKEPTSDMVQSENWVKTFLAAPISHAPGSTFMYNSGATYLCSAIVQQVTGQKIIDYLQPRLFEPLAIAGMTWETCPRGISVGGWGLSIQTEGLAKFGLLYQQKGVWKNRQLLPAAWVDEATCRQVQQPLPTNPGRPNAQNDWVQGYGYQFWRCTHSAFRGDGAFGQYTIVMPEPDAVLAITSESPNMQGQLDLVWEHVLPAMKGQPLPADPAAHSRLQERLKALALSMPRGQRTSPTARGVAGKTFKLDTNALGLVSAAFTFQADGCHVSFGDGQAQHVIACGLEAWQPGETALPGTPPRLVSGGAPKRGTPSRLVASGAWKDATTFEMLWRYVETPHHDRVTCRFDGDQVTITFLNSMAAMSPTPKDPRPMLQGRSP